MATVEPEDVEELEDTASMSPDSRPNVLAPPVQHRIGPYRLLHVIGEGGVGEVWVADQLEPVKRRVALKVIKAGSPAFGLVVEWIPECCCPAGLHSGSRTTIAASTSSTELSR
jgi:hypothetical protein